MYLNTINCWTCISKCQIAREIWMLFFFLHEALRVSCKVHFGVSFISQWIEKINIQFLNAYRNSQQKAIETVTSKGCSQSMARREKDKKKKQTVTHTKETKSAREADSPPVSFPREVITMQNRTLNMWNLNNTREHCIPSKRWNGWQTRPPGALKYLYYREFFNLCCIMAMLWSILVYR